MGKSGKIRFAPFLTALLAVFLSSVSVLPANAQSVSGEVQSAAGQKSGAAGLLPVIVSAPVLFKTKPSTFDVSISVADITGEGIFAFQFNVLYDPAVIDPSGTNFGCSTTGTIAQPANLTATCNVLPDGVLRVAVSGTAAMTGSGTILKLTFSTDPAVAVGSISPLTFQSVFFFNGGGRVPVTTTNGSVTIVAPTAASVSVSGSVMSAVGQPVSKAKLLLTDQSGATQTALSNPFGFFRFDNVTAGQTYVISVKSKTFVFAPRILTVADDVTDLNLIAEP